MPACMAKILVCLGRFAFFALTCVQSYSLTSYPAKYEHNDDLHALVLLFLPALGLWLFIMCKDENLQWLFLVWMLYVWIGLVPLIGTIFGGNDPIENKLDSEAFFGPNVLKITLCASPVILLLLLSTGTNSMSYRELIWMLSLRIALDLFDGVEMLEVILEENEVSHKVPRSFELAIISFVCISFLLSPLQLMEIKLPYRGNWKSRKCTSALRKTFQILAVNGVFLGLRLALYRIYGKDASIFIAKNFIIILLSLFEICSTSNCCGCDDDGSSIF